MKIYLIRHGEVNHNKVKQFNNEDEDLTDLGIEQAKNLSNIIENIDYDLIISSPLIRAKHTAQIINVKNKEIIFDNRLIERDPGSLSGHSFDKEKREDYWNYYSENKYGTSEDIKKFFDRVYNFLDELKTKDYKNILIVTHSGVAKAFKAYFEGICDGKFLGKGLKNCEIKEYELGS